MRRRVTPLILALVAAAACLAGGAPRAQTVEQGRALAQALKAAEAGEWGQAAARAGAARSPVVRDIVRWLRLRDGAGTWDEYLAFFGEHPDWPAQAALRKGAERAMPPDLPAGEAARFFQGAPPSTGSGALRLAGALEEDGDAAAGADLLRRAWREMSLTVPERAAFAARGGALGPGDDLARLDMLLWRGLTEEAEAMLPRVGEDQRQLAEARIAVRTGVDGSTALIRALPAALRDDPGLAFERYRYRVGKGRWDEAEAHLRARSVSAEALGRPDMWMERRANLARAALRRGDVAAAYELAARNFGNAQSGADYADAEWVAGYVALTRMDAPERAAAHFRRFGAAVGTPISLGRAGYWLGLAEERAGNSDAARAAFAQGALHQTSFYGQLAAERIGAAPDAALAGDVETPDWREADFLGRGVVQAGAFLVLAGDDSRAAQFLRGAAEGMEAGDRAALAQMAMDLERPQIALRLAKDAAAAGLVLPEQYYPLTALAEADWPAPTEFALAIARQESEFDPGAVSSSGARGLMQLMPGTAEHVAGLIGVGYDLNRLTADPGYNAALGTAYLAKLLDDFRGSYLLAAAAYNAGPGRAGAWIAEYGDPRDGAVDPVAWIETIPFAETRNYVMRVLESLHVYRARLGGGPIALRLGADIQGAG